MSELQQMKKRIEELEQKNEKLLSCVEFYADTKQMNHECTDGYGYLYINDEDIGMISGSSFRHYGKLARATLKEIRGEK